MLLVWCVFACTLSANFQRCSERQFIVQAVFSTPSFPLSTVHLAWWVPVSFSCVGARGWVPGFASYRSSLHLEAGCQQRKLLDVSGTQPPLSDAVFNVLKKWYQPTLTAKNTGQNWPTLVNYYHTISKSNCWIFKRYIHEWFSRQETQWAPSLEYLLTPFLSSKSFLQDIKTFYV